MKILHVMSWKYLNLIHCCYSVDLKKHTVNKSNREDVSALTYFPVYLQLPGTKTQLGFRLQHQMKLKSSFHF